MDSDTLVRHEERACIYCDEIAWLWAGPERGMSHGRSLAHPTLSKLSVLWLNWI